MTSPVESSEFNQTASPASPSPAKLLTTHYTWPSLNSYSNRSIQAHMNGNHVSTNIHRVQLPPFWITAAGFAIGFIFNYLLFLAALFDDVIIPSLSGMLAILNVSIILIFTTRLYLRILSIFIGYRTMARLILYPFIAWHATWFLCIPPVVYSIVIAHYYYQYAQPAVDESMFVGHFLLAAPFASWICIINYLNNIKEANTQIMESIDD